MPSPPRERANRNGVEESDDEEQVSDSDSHSSDRVNSASAAEDDNLVCDLSGKNISSKKIADIVPFDVVTLNLSENRIDNLASWDVPESCESLDLSRNKITSLRGAFRKSGKSLKYLDLSNNFIDKMGSLGIASSITKLVLRDNWISSVRGLDGLLHLRHLDLSGNLFEKSTSIRSLSLNKKLRTLLLRGNPIAKSPGYAFVLMNILPQITRVDDTTKKARKSVKRSKKRRQKAKRQRKTSAGSTSKSSRTKTPLGRATLNASYLSIHSFESLSPKRRNDKTPRRVDDVERARERPSTSELVVSQRRRCYSGGAVVALEDEGGGINASATKTRLDFDSHDNSRIVDCYRDRFDWSPNHHPSTKVGSPSMERRRQRAMTTIRAKRRISIALRAKSGRELLAALRREDVERSGLLTVRAVTCALREFCEGMTEAESKRVAFLLLKGQRRRFPSNRRGRGDAEGNTMIDYEAALRQFCEFAPLPAPMDQEDGILSSAARSEASTKRVRRATSHTRAKSREVATTIRVRHGRARASSPSKTRRRVAPVDELSRRGSPLFSPTRPLPFQLRTATRSLRSFSRSKRFSTTKDENSRAGDSILSSSKLRTIRQKLRAAAYAGPKGCDLGLLFRRLDINRSGVLSRYEFGRALKKSARLSDRELGVLWKFVDANGDGKISVVEFSKFVHGTGFPKRRNNLRQTVVAAVRERTRKNKEMAADASVERDDLRSGTRRVGGEIPSPTSLDADLKKLGVLDTSERGFYSPSRSSPSPGKRPSGHDGGEDIERESRDLESLLETIIARKERSLAALTTGV
eukprot:g1580.t1